MDIQEVAHRLEDPIHYVCEEAILALGNPTMAQLTGYVMGHLPDDAPRWADRYIRNGVQHELKATLKRLGRIYRDGRYMRAAGLTIRQGWEYVAHLEESTARDIARIRSWKRDLRRAEVIAGSVDSIIPIGELLGWDEDAA